MLSPGIPLQEALIYFEELGTAFVDLFEVKSKKGLASAYDARFLTVKKTENGIRIYFAYFKTDME